MVRLEVLLYQMTTRNKEHFNSCMVRLEVAELTGITQNDYDFNSCMVRLEVCTRCTSSDLINISIPVWYDWKGVVYWIVGRVEIYFNSCMVRLEDLRRK